jgi:putative spermidine/putrescine transport system permease protein
MRRYVDDLLFGVVILSMALTVAYLITPLIISCLMSFDSRTYLGRFPPPGVSIQWYKHFFSTPDFMHGLRTSLILATFSTLIASVTGVLAAVVIGQYEFKGKAMLSSLFLSPLMVPGVVTGFGLLMFFALLGVFDGFTRLLAGHVIVTIPYTIRSTIAALTGIRPSMREAAMSLGATGRQAFFDITLPLAKTGIIAGGIFAFSTSLDDVSTSLFLYDPYSTTLPIALVSYMRANFDMAVAAASVFLAFLTLVLIIVLDRMVGLDKVMGQGIYRG